jgi:hypothetical protein
MKLRALFLFMLGLLLLAACRGGDDDSGVNSPDTRNITLRPVPVRTLIDGCPQQDLEDWFEVSYFNIQSFIDISERESLAANDNRRNEIDVVIDDLQGYRNVVTSVATPICVEAVHADVLSGMETILSSFQQFANAEIGAEALVDQVTRDLQPMKATIDNLLEDTAPLYQIDPPTPSP